MSEQAWAALAVALQVTGAALTFGLRAWVQRRATGDSGVRRPSSRTARWAGPLFVLGLAVVLAGLLLTALGVMDTAVQLPSPGRWVAAAVAVVGHGCAILAQVGMGASWRMGLDPAECTELVTGGLFRVVRNPFFSAIAVGVLGLVLMAPTVTTSVGLVTVVVAMQVQVRVMEEPNLRAVHGVTYDDWAARVGRFVPLLGRIGGVARPPDD